MAGHSKWANIKRQKARVDAKKGKTFTQLSRAIIVAVRNGTSDPEGNFQLRSAIAKAKAAGIPNDNIERSIAKGAGLFQEKGQIFEEICYEGYGIGGVAIMVEAFTDNRNRTAADVRVAFSKNGGNLGETGCVNWIFAQKGVILLNGKINENNLLDISLEGGADYYELAQENQNLQFTEVITSTDNLENLKQTLQKAKFSIQDLELRWIPNSRIKLSEPEQIQSLIKTIDTLESLDDVQNVTTNLDYETHIDPD